MTSRYRATLAGLAAILLWSMLALLTATSGAVPPFQLLALSFGLASLAGLGVLAVQGKLASLRQPSGAALLATAGLFGYHALYFASLKSAPVVEANLINYLWPLLIVLFAGLLPGERLRPAVLVGTLMGLAGAVLVVTRGVAIDLDPAHRSGYLAALAAAVVWSLYSVLNRRFSEIPSHAILGPCLATALLGGVAHLLFEATVAPTLAQWLGILLMGLGPVGAAFWLWDAGTKRGDLAVLGVLSYAAPLLSTAWLLLGGHAQPHWTQALAVGLLVTGAAIALRQRRAK